MGGGQDISDKREEKKISEGVCRTAQGQIQKHKKVGGRPHLLLDGVAALLRDVDEVQHAALEVGQRRDGLHLDRVALLERMVQDAGSVHHLVRRVKSEVERSNIFSSINYIVRVGVDFYIGFVWSVLDRLGLSLGSS